MNCIKRKAMCLLAVCSLFAAGPCTTIDSWNLAIGPAFSGGSPFAGVELELSNGLDVLVPLVSLKN